MSSAAKRRIVALGVALLALACVAVPAAASVLGWWKVPSPNPAGSAALNGIACVSASTCMAVGQSSAGTFAEAGGGAKWQISPTPNPAGAAGGSLNGVACPSPNTCFAVGVAFDGDPFGGNPNSVGSVTEQWNGTSWSLQATPTAHQSGTFLNAVSCSSPTACTAVGATGSPSIPIAERWDGTSWTSQTVPAPSAPQSFLTGVACTSASSCIAVGQSNDSGNNAVGTLFEQWDGTSWQIQPSPTAQTVGDGIGAVSCTSSSACTAVGATATGLLAERWDGTAWTVQAPVQPAGSGNYFGGVSCPSVSQCTAVGVKFVSSPYTIAERWNGSTWATESMPPLNTASDIGLQAVSCPSVSGCTAVGGFAGNTPMYTLIEQYGTLPCTVPNVKGKTLKAAERAVGAAHCTLGRITKRSSATVKAGHVISQNPKPKLTEPQGTKIALVVSRARKHR